MSGTIGNEVFPATERHIELGLNVENNRQPRNQAWWLSPRHQVIIRHKEWSRNMDLFIEHAY